MATRIETPGNGTGRGQPLDGERVLEGYYAGAGVPCPVGCGGAAEVVRTGSLEDGAGEVWVECGSCAQRVRYRVPGASEVERDGVARVVGAGMEPACPRHAERVPLQRRGQRLVCPGCGVRFRE